MENSLTRQCWVCHETYPLTHEHFYKDKKDKSGLQKRCRECNKKTNKRFIERNPNYFLDKSKDWYNDAKKDNPNFNKDRYSKYREQYLTRRKKWSLSEYGKLYNIFQAAKERSVKKQIEFNLTFEAIVDMYNSQDGKCSLTGLKLITDEFKIEGQHYHPYAPSIDKINPDKGYTLDNIRIVAVITNLALNKFGDAIFDDMCKSYIFKKYNIKV